MSDDNNVIRIKLVLRMGAIDGYLVRCTPGGSNADFFPVNDATRTPADIISAGPTKSFPSMLDASKYVYGCMRRVPNAKYAIFAIDAQGVCWHEGDFTELRSLLFSSNAGIDLPKFQFKVGTRLNELLNIFPRGQKKEESTMDLFDKMKAKIKSELPEYEGGPDDDAPPSKKHGNFDGKVGVQTANEFLKKYKNRGATVEA